MNSFSIKTLWPYLAAIVAIIVCCSLYFSPVFQGKTLVQNDIVKNDAQKAEVLEYKEKGETILWTSRVFSGMTVFHIGAEFNTNIILPIRKSLMFLPKGLNIAFVCSLGMFILLIMFGVNPWLAAIGALGYGLSSNLLSSLMAGHNTKILTIAYVAPALGSIILTFRGKLLVGGFLTALFIGLMIASNHLQIVYYFLLVCLIGGGVHLFHAIRDKQLPDFAKQVGVLVVAGLIGVLPNFSKIYNIQQHSKETIRGGQKLLTSKDKKDEGGLDRGYAMSWSHGLMESFTVVVPSVLGGSSQEELPKDGEVAALVGKQARNRPLMGPTYIGDQPFLQGTIYFGAAFIFLFILSLFVIEGKYKTWFIGIIILSFFIGWGKNWSWFTYLLFDYLPLYNKFRTPSMALSLAGLAMPAMGIIGLSHILQNKVDSQRLKTAFKYTLYVSGGMMLLLLLHGLTSDWSGPKDSQLPKPWNDPQLYDALLSDRKSLFMSDWLISTVIMAITGGLVWLYSLNKVKMPILLSVIAIVAIGDNWRVSKRYLNNDSFKAERQYAGMFNPTPVDKALMSDTDPHHRVIDLTKNPWTDGHTCYHHENIGGHHAAKLQRYQDMIENQFGTQLQIINGAIMQGPTGLTMNPQVSRRMSAFNMLNTKYYIVQNSPDGIVENPTACGNAWFVSNINSVSTHDEEMAQISEIDPLETAIIHTEFDEEMNGYSFGKSPNSKIELTSFKPDHLVYKSNNMQAGLAVFSEVIYTNGWKAYVDGNEVPILRANYILRAIKIPTGNHEIEMKFEPSSYSLGENVSLAGSILFALFGIGVLYFQFKSQARPKPSNEID